MQEELDNFHKGNLSLMKALHWWYCTMVQQRM